MTSVPRHRSRSKRQPAGTIPTTRVSVIIVTGDRKILLVKHKKGQRSYWVLPGGRLEYGETFEECGVREVKEETGLDVAIERIIYLSEAIAPDRSRHIVNVYMTAQVTGGTLRLGDEPVLAGVEFVDVSELSTQTLYPPVAEHILKGIECNFQGPIQYLGNLWV